MGRDKKIKMRENEQLWIDYLEGELDPSFKQDLDIQLNHSPEAQKLTSQYIRLKSEIKNLDTVPSFSRKYYDDLHNKIMNKVSHKSIQSPVFSLFYQKNKLLAIAASFLLVLGSLFAWNLHQSGGLLNSQDDVAVSPIGEWLLEEQEEEDSKLLEQKEIKDEYKDADKDNFLE